MSKSVAPPINKNRKGSNQLRIIGGLWRGRKLGFPDVDGLRPTGDRIRETLFNWLAPDIQGARCLDLFTGSGALGLEALSRGAGYSLMRERNAQAARQLHLNLQLLQATQGEVAQGDAMAWLEQPNSDAPFDLVFIDPPFQLDLWQRVIDALESGRYLTDEAAIYIESGKDNNYQVPSSWRLHRDKTAGNVCYRLFYRSKSGTTVADVQ